MRVFFLRCFLLWISTSGRANLQEWSLLFYGTTRIPFEIPYQRTSQPSSSKYKSSLSRTNTFYLNSKINKTGAHGSSHYFNRKNYKNIKNKSSTTFRTDKSSSIGNGENVKILPTISYRNLKTTKKYLNLNGHKNNNSTKGFSKTILTPLSTHSLPLTIVLEPGGESYSRQRVPDVFQKYPKIQQLFPLYVNTSQEHQEGNNPILISKINNRPDNYYSKSSSKNKGHAALQKAERQNRFDTSLSRTSTEGKINGNRPIQGKIDYLYIYYCA